MSGVSSFFSTSASRSSTSGAEQKQIASRPWVEKYRPKSMKDIAHQEEVVKTLINSIETGNLPHLLFYGPPGTGKTSTILAVARELFGPALWKDRVLELNASDERGIGVVRNKIKTFAMGAVGTSSAATGVAPFKLIILDEADSLTPDAQTALRRTMELYSKQTRFCLICNYISRIIEPIASRCAKFRFKPLHSDSMKRRLELIAESESVQVEPAVFDQLVHVSGGDMRKSIMFLQSAVQFYGATGITPECITEIAGVLPEKSNQQLWNAVKSTSFESVKSAARSLSWSGYAMSAILDKILESLLVDDQIADTKKAKIAQKLATADKQLNDGADEQLQLMDVLATIQRILHDATVTADTQRHLY